MLPQVPPAVLALPRVALRCSLPLDTKCSPQIARCRCLQPSSVAGTKRCSLSGIGSDATGAFFCARFFARSASKSRLASLICTHGIARVHGQLEQLLVLAQLPVIFLHLFAILIQLIRIQILWIARVELAPLLLAISTNSGANSPPTCPIYPASYPRCYQQSCSSVRGPSQAATRSLAPSFSRTG